MSIANWPELQRPREKLIRFGAGTLSDAELLSVFLRVGIPGKSAVELGNDLLQRFGTLQNLVAAPLEQFVAIRGLGPAKFAQLKAVLEMTRRTLDEELRSGIRMNQRETVRDYLHLLIGSKPFETFVVMYLDVKMRLLQCEEMFRGGLYGTKVYPREVVRNALKHNAAAAILAHNHPSGDIHPSAADIDLTIQLKSTLAAVEVNLVDHFVIAGNASYSFSEHGLI